MSILETLGIVILFLLISAYLGAIIYICFGYAFYPTTFKDKGIWILDLLPADWFFLFGGILYAFFHWLFKKILPERIYLAIFRSFAFLFGSILLLSLLFIWFLVIKNLVIKS